MKFKQLRIILVLCLIATAHVPATLLHVEVNGASPPPSYASWATAVVTIHQAIDAALAGDRIVVTNGVGQTAGRVIDGAMISRVVVDSAGSFYLCGQSLSDLEISLEFLPQSTDLCLYELKE